MRLLPIFLILIFVLTACSNPAVQNLNTLETGPAPLAVKKVEDLPVPVIPVSVEPNAEILPAKVDWLVPFVSQAPEGDWGLPYQEACEEAALIQASHYFKRAPLSKGIMKQELLATTEWEKQTFGLYTDTTLAEVKKMAEDYFGLKVAISDQVTGDNFKKQLAAGNLILLPAAGRLLKNPYYSGAGPLYHFLVLRGYNENKFITNDVGTKRGEDYQYSLATLLSAIHDLPLKSDGSVFRPYGEPGSDADKELIMLQGAQRILIVQGLK